MSMRPVRAGKRVKHQGHQEHQEVFVVKRAPSRAEIQKTNPIWSHFTRRRGASKVSWCSWWPWCFTLFLARTRRSNISSPPTYPLALRAGAHGRAARGLRSRL